MTGNVCVAIAGAPVSDDAAFDRFVAEHRPSLVRVAALMCGSVAQAEDIVQEVLIRLYPRWQTLDDPLPYARRSITNEFVSWRRRWSTRHVRPVPDGVLVDAAPPVDPWRDSPDPALWAHLQRLPRQQRAAVVLRFYEGLSDEEIAVALSCRPGTVRAHVSRGLATLRTALGDEEGDDDRS